jgi:Ring finger domain
MNSFLNDINGTSLYPSFGPSFSISPTSDVVRTNVGSIGYLPFASFFILLCFFFCAFCIVCSTPQYRTVALLAVERTGMTTLLLTPEQLEEIGEFKYGDLKSEVPMPEECAICLSSFETDEICRELPMPCSHCFHKTCIDTWLLKSSKCPLCNRSIYGIMAQMKEEREKQMTVADLNKNAFVLPDASTPRIDGSVNNNDLEAARTVSTRRSTSS